jgi:hypothetical protein
MRGVLLFGICIGEAYQPVASTRLRRLSPYCHQNGIAL